MGASINITLVGLDAYGNSWTDSQSYVQEEVSKTYTYSFPASSVGQSQLINIEMIILTGWYNGKTIAYKEIPVIYGTDEDMAKFALVANGIYMSVQEAGFSFTSDGLTVSNGKIIIKNHLGQEVFKADDEGNLSFTGEINSISGGISGWIIEDDELVSDTKQVGIHSGPRRFYGDDTSPVRFWAGPTTSTEQTIGENDQSYYNFAVTEKGTLYAQRADISGNVVARSGRILNTFYIGPNDTSGIIINGDENSSYIGSMRQASGALGGGWIINSDGSAEFNNVSVRGKITSSVFEYNHISAVGGSLYVAPTLYTTISSDYIISLSSTGTEYLAAWTLSQSVREAFGNKEISVGDQILLDCNINLGAEIIHLSGIQTTIALTKDGDQDTMFGLVFTYEQDLSDAIIEPGAALVYYGTSDRREGLYLTAMGSDSPYLDVYSNTYDEDAPIPAARLGNLNGITDASFSSIGGRLSGFGLYSSNAFLRGQLMLPSAGITNQSTVMVENSPVRIWAGVESLNDISQANFIVTEDGSLHAKQGTFEGIVKANNSEFSGNIRAAGILLEQEDLEQNDTLHDHFYVAYNILENGEFTPSYKNYVLNIDKDGLSIWEGGLQAYSDFANGENGFEGQDSHLEVYKYGIESSNSAFPFMYLVDSGTNSELTSRIVTNKLHALTFTPYWDGSNTVFPIISTRLDNGIWFYGETYNINNIASFRAQESTIFNQSKDTGLTLYNDSTLLLKNEKASGTIYIRASNGTFINPNDTDEANYPTNALVIRGNTQWVNNEKVVLHIADAIIEEVKVSGKTIGLNFIATAS